MLEYFNKKDIIQGDFALILSRGKRSVNCICDTLNELVNNADELEVHYSENFHYEVYHALLCFILRFYKYVQTG